MMLPKTGHDWELQPAEARLMQRSLAGCTVREDRIARVRTVAGIDVGYHGKSDRIVAAVVVVDAATLDVLEIALARDRARFPYLSGLLSFRELPVCAQALERLTALPDLLVCDGHGIAHPRRFGLASHLGVVFDLPTIGCAKTRLIGTHDEPDWERGASAPLLDRKEIIGNVLRTRSGVKPVYVSIGHRISLELACHWVLRLAPRYRLPETTRLADKTVREEMRKLLSEEGGR